MQVPSSSHMHVGCIALGNLNLNHHMPSTLRKRDENEFTIRHHPHHWWEASFILLPNREFGRCTSLFGPSKHTMQGNLSLMKLGWGSSA